MFTQNWCTHLPAAIERAYLAPPTHAMRCVEVGSFEGRGSLIIADHLCKHPESKVYCIDPWEDVYTTNVKEFQNLDPLFQGQYKRFLKNTEHVSSIIPLKGASDTQIPLLQDDSIDFAYIDGDHSPGQVYLDGTNMHPKIKRGGILIFDDYQWEYNGLRCRDGVDRFIGEHTNEYDLVFKDWHVILRKK